MSAPNTTPEAKPGKLEFIEGMRGVAALYVLLGHCITMIDPFHKLEKSGSWVGKIAPYLWHGHLAVAAFIVISGYCLQIALFNRGDGRLKDIGGFLKRRCRRILPPYYACLGISMLVVTFITVNQKGMPWAQYVPVSNSALWAHILMLHNLQPEWMYKINGVLWSIGIEFQLYFFFPLLVAALWKWGGGRVVAAASVVALLLAALFVPAMKLYVWFIPLFALGMASAYWALQPKNFRIPVGFVGLVALGSMILTIEAPRLTKDVWLGDIGIGIFAATIMMLGTRRPSNWTARSFGVAPLVSLGAFSYSLYLVHHPLLQIFYVNRPASVVSQGDQLLYTYGLGVPLITIACYLFYLMFERPFMSGSSPEPAKVRPTKPSPVTASETTARIWSMSLAPEPMSAQEISRAPQAFRGPEASALVETPFVEPPAVPVPQPVAVAPSEPLSALEPAAAKAGPEPVVKPATAMPAVEPVKPVEARPFVQPKVDPKPTRAAKPSKQEKPAAKASPRPIVLVQAKDPWHGPIKKLIRRLTGDPYDQV